MAREAIAQGMCPPNKNRAYVFWGMLLLCCALALGVGFAAAEAWAAASGQGRYGTPLRFDPPPVDLEEPVSRLVAEETPAVTQGTDSRPDSALGATDGRLLQNIDA